MSPPPSDPGVFAGCDWLELDVPPDAVWPRLMTSRHPDAVGSLGPECIVWARQWLGIELRWWQRIVLCRILEVNNAGELLWLNIVLSLPRQVGKSWLLRVLAMWRIHQSQRFGEEQTVMHISRGLSASREVQRAARVWARARKDEGYNAREQNGAQEVSCPDGSRWLIRDQDGAYSFSASLAVVDEAWGVDPAHIDEGLEPTLPERVQPQLMLVSTAHRRCTGLVPARRAAALARLGEPSNTLLIEWSAPLEAGLSVDSARAASPFWGPARERLAVAAFERVGVGAVGLEETPADAFNSQWLNRWPVAAYSRENDAPLVEEAAWAGCADLTASAVGGLVLAVDDRTGMGAAVAAAGMSSGGRVLVWGQLCGSRARAAAWVAWACETHPGSRVLVGASLSADDGFRGGSRVPAADQLSALPKLRELVAGGRLVHDGGSELAGQVVSARVAERQGGLAIVSHGRCDLARCAAWAVAACASAPAPRAKWAML